ncbi:hypothetical protein BaRGS_00026025, partial [Batillaria attramentaria]
MIKILCLACVLIVSLSKATPAISESGINKRLLKFQFSLGSLPKFIGSIERLLDKCKARLRCQTNPGRLCDKRDVFDELSDQRNALNMRRWAVGGSASVQQRLLQFRLWFAYLKLRFCRINL